MISWWIMLQTVVFKCTCVNTDNLQTLIFNTPIVAASNELVAIKLDFTYSKKIMDKILDNSNPTVQEVKEWGFDEQTSFIDQDEDLILHDSKYIAVLMELASDMNCPKNDYCLSILTCFTQIKLAKRENSDLAKIEKHIEEYNKPISISVEKWKTMFLYLYSFIKNPQPITESIADNIAYNLTVGKYCLRDFEKLGFIDSGVIEYLASTSSYKEYFYIELETSYWRSSKYSRLDKT